MHLLPRSTPLQGIGAVGLQCALHFCVLRAMGIIFDHANRMLSAPPLPNRSFGGTASPVGLSSNGPSAQFAAASTPSTGYLDELSRAAAPPFPSFAQTSQSAADVPWKLNAASVRTLPSSLPDPLFSVGASPPASF